MGERVATRRVLTDEARSSRRTWMFASHLSVWDAEAVEEEGGGVLLSLCGWYCSDRDLTSRSSSRPSRIRLKVQISHQRPTVGSGPERCLGTENNFPVCLCRTSFGVVKLCEEDGEELGDGRSEARHS